jgi:hypothetical protein
MVDPFSNRVPTYDVVMEIGSGKGFELEPC